MDDTSTGRVSSLGRLEDLPQRAGERARVAGRRTALTVVVPIRRGHASAELSKVLEAVGRDIRRNTLIPLDALKTTHFLRWVIVPAARGEAGQEGRELLAFEANFDGDVGSFLDDLIRVAGKALRTCIYCHCEPSPPARGENPDAALKDYLLDHALPEALFYQSYPGLTVESIDNDARVRRLINEYLSDSQGACARLMRLARRRTGRPGRSRSEESRLQQDIRQDIRSHLEQVQAREAKEKAEGVLRLEPEPVPWKARLLRMPLVRNGMAALVMPVAVPTWLTLLGLELAEGVAQWVKGGESKPATATYDSKARAKLSELLEREDFQAQNQLTHLVDLKPGALRPPLARLSLWVWGYLARYYFTEGQLGGIEGIHFARWVMLEDEVEGEEGPRKKHRMLFFSNYDGSWEDYLGSFVDRASIGLTTIWCSTEGFPRTRLRLRPFGLELGADREEAFKLWVRQHQVYTEAWFTRHPGKSVSNIVNDRELRSKVKARLSSRQVRDWLRRI